MTTAKYMGAKDAIRFVKPSPKNKNGWQHLLPAVPFLT
jgi:hypothetical protein